MARLEALYRCPCGALHQSVSDAKACALRHIRPEEWAIGERGKGVRIYPNHSPEIAHGTIGALIEADLSDIIEERKWQLKEMKKGGDDWKHPPRKTKFTVL